MDNALLAETTPYDDVAQQIRAEALSGYCWNVPEAEKLRAGCLSGYRWNVPATWAEADTHARAHWRERARRELATQQWFSERMDVSHATS